MDKIYVTADPHFNHENIIEHCGRPFNNLEHMHRVLINKWNSAVKLNDIIIIVGDMALYNAKCDFDTIIHSLNGRKILVQGNHDRKSRTFYLMHGFNMVCDCFTLNNYVFTHEPLKQIRTGFINVHGHIHEKLIHDARYINICVEQTNYTPVALENICNFNKKIKINAV